MSGRADLCEALLDQGAPIDCAYVREAPHFTMMKGHTPLAVAGQYATLGQYHHRLTAT